jgi:carboxypeptidase C (cathepsin A)
MRGTEFLRRAAWRAVFALALAACGGGDGSPPLPPLGAGEAAYDDPVAYASDGDASLPGAVEGAAVTRHSLVLRGATLAYTARAGHLIARDPASGAAEASMFYVDYTADGASTASRPVTFFYNGGPGSASVWLHLGSFGPRRLATGVPGTGAPQPFPLVDNADTLLDGSDLVFVDAVGCGLSTAIAPYRNRDFWGVDVDAALFRDFIVRWLAVNGRAASPLYLYGESYGGPRTALLARRLQEAGVAPTALVLQSPALDYNSNCGVSGAGDCSNALPSYAAIGAFHGLASPLPADLDGYMADLRDFTAGRYAPAVAALLASATPPPADLPPLLAGYTGLPASVWSMQFNLAPDTFRSRLVAGQLIGRYDGRMLAPSGSPLAREGDPSSTYLAASFASVIASYLRDTLRYSNASTYVLLSSAGNTWNYAHAGRPLPDTVPDLAAALAQDPALRVLAVSGYHDLATPFRVTELDLARLGAEPRVQVRNYPGGHMSYLDDATRPRQRADLAAFYRSSLAVRVAREMPQARLARPAVDRAGVVPTARQPVLAEPALQTPMRDPWVPPTAAQASGM